MSQQSACSDPQSQFLTYSWDAPLALRWYRDAVFDGISHSAAFGALDIGVKAVSKAYGPLPEPVKMSQNYRAVEKRLAAKDRAVLIQEAQDKGIYAYAKHFGNWDSGVTWKRLLAHYERGGQFPPTRNELNSLMLEF